MNYGTASTLGVQASNKPSIPAPANAMQEFGHRLSALYETLGVNTERLDRVLDRAYGSQKTDGAASNPRAVPNGEIGALMERLDELSALADRQSGVIARIDGIV